MSPIVLRQASAWLVHLRDESVTNAERADFEVWLRTSPEHEAAFAQVSQTVGGFIELKRELRAEIGEDTFASRASHSRRAAPIAAVVALVLLGAGLAGYRALGPATYSTALGEQRSIELTDGSTLVLNTHTRVRVRLARGERLIRLDRGEASFVVAHDPDRPFIVEAAGEVVRALGTEFVVRVDDEGLRVLVVEGVVAVEAKTASQARTRLAAGQRLERAHSEAQIATVSQTEMNRDLAWRSGMLEFAGQPLGEAAAEVARYTRTRFDFADAAAAQTPVWAYFRADDVDGFVRSLETNIPDLSIEREGETVRIATRRAAQDAP